MKSEKTPRLFRGQIIYREHNNLPRGREIFKTYSVTVTDDMGCTSTDEITIIVRLPECDETDVFLPSAFTPNGDGINDVLYLRSNFIESMELVIFNRWGRRYPCTVEPAYYYSDF
jgi:hypothetical protein